MQRRDFIKISAITGATTALESCGHPEVQLIRFVPEEELTPGVAAWKPSLCTMCPAGCGTLVRVMEGETEVVRNGQLGLIKMGLAKKLEGNPEHPINRGKLCPRGHAALQTTYHPDRIRTPLKRAGEKGSGQFQEVSWEEAVKELVSQLAALRGSNQAASLSFVMRPLRGHRRMLIERLLGAFGAPPPVTFEFFDDAVLRQANLLSFGHYALPTLDLARSNYVISFGADFLGTWNSPVAQAIGYGEMRQGRPGVRAKFVQVEPRMSQTSANADEWVPARPGTEGLVALGLAHVILNEKLRPTGAAGRAGALIEGWSSGLPQYSPQEVEKQTGVPATTVRRLAREMATHGPAVALIAGAPLAHTNGLFNALAVNALNALLDAVEKPGGILFTPPLSLTEAKSSTPTPSAQGSHSALRALVEQILLSRPLAPKVVLLDGVNPVFGTPAEWRVREAFEKVPFLVSFGSFVDETSALADLILPDHTPLESWVDDLPESGTTLTLATVAAPAVRPLHNTRAMPDVLLDVARQLGEDIGKELPWKDFEEMLRTSLERLAGQESGSKDFWSKVQKQGGWWREPAAIAAVRSPEKTTRAPIKYSPPEFDGPEKDFPFHFLPYASQLFHDGSLAHLPWMQEAPDPLTSAMWSTWIEINPTTAERLNIRQGDLVEVASPHGKLRAPAFLSPGIAPDVIAMPVGQGHENFTRYASGRGANPIAILSPTKMEPETGSLAWAATRVRVSRVGEGKLILFAGDLRERPHEHEQR